ncbi:MAG: hypothetical protein ACFE85_19740 [Candidatus Hodarchaeota archaeon]
MDKVEKSEESKEFQWKDYIKKSKRDSQIQEFIIYQKQGKERNKYIIIKYEKSNEHNIEMLNLIQEILNNTTNLSSKQIIDYCKNQRYFMKLYFKQLQEKRK